jgi:hypothetical protein
VKIGILGGTGPAGRALAARLAAVGHDVVIGSRSAERAQEICDEVVAAWPARQLALSGADNEGAASAEVVVVATPWDAAADTAASVAAQLEGKVVISMANALVRAHKQFTPLIPGRGSIAAHVQAAVPGALVAAAFQHLPARELGDLDAEVECDVLICSDHRRATDVTAEITASIPGCRALDAGGLGSASPVEAFTALLLQLNVRYKTRVAVRMTGIPDPS